MTSDKQHEGAEMVSALADGQLQGAALAQALDFIERDPQARDQWRTIHLVRDVLNDPACAVDPRRDAEFMQRLRQRLDREVRVQRPGALPRSRTEMGVPLVVKTGSTAANDTSLRWSRWAGLASVGLMAWLGWQWTPWLHEPAGTSQGPQWAQVAPVPNPELSLGVAEPAVMVRDPRLDQLLAAHQQLGAASALQGPAGFLRNATFERPAR